MGGVRSEVKRLRCNGLQPGSVMHSISLHRAHSASAADSGDDSEEENKQMQTEK
jgi:hypothetical protein